MSTIILSFFSSIVSADPLVGIWQTVNDDNGNFGHVKIETCDDSLCGVLVTSFGPDLKPRESEHVGRTLKWEMKNLGGGKYGEGKIYSPDRDKTYSSKLVLDGYVLSRSGE
jgi:uncharacterized protein (DUF2147 family)